MAEAILRTCRAVKSLGDAPPTRREVFLLALLLLALYWAAQPHVTIVEYFGAENYARIVT